MIREHADGVRTGAILAGMMQPRRFVPVLRAATLASLAAAVAACSSGTTPDIPDVERTAILSEHRCQLPAQPPTPYPMEQPTAVPYPTPAGGQLTPKFDVPDFPRSVQLDGFKARDHLDRAIRVQLFETAAPKEEVFAFFEEALLDIGLVVGSSGVGIAGWDCTFIPLGESGDIGVDRWLRVTTAPVIRDPRGSTTPPPGYRGFGQPYASPVPGKLWYWVVTPD
jgi:hypothetical protein